MSTNKLIALLGLCLASLACTPSGKDSIRTDAMSFHRQADCQDEPLTAIAVNVKEGTETLYLKTSMEDVDIFWEDAAGSPWAQVESVTQAGAGIYEITLSHADRSAGVMYSRRGGTLTAVAPAQNFGVFLPVWQGAQDRVLQDFADWTYGTLDPHSTTGEVLAENWSTALKNKGFTSEPAEGAQSGYCYGRYGCVRLGDAEGHKGNILTPRSDYFRYDSLLVVSFRAAAYKDAIGTRDANKFRVEVTGGGFIRDFAAQEQTWIELEAPYITSEEDFMGNSWFLVFVADSDRNPMTASTRIKISSGAGSVSGNSRLFLDDICVARLVPDLDEDYYSENSGSGPDTILAARNEK